MTFCERVVMLDGRLIRANAVDPFNIDPATGKPRKASSATAYSWVIWLREPGGEWITDTRHRWIAPSRTALERPDDYPDYSGRWPISKPGQMPEPGALPLSDDGV